MDERPKRGWVGVVGAIALVLAVILIWQIMRAGGPEVAPPTGQSTPGTQPVN